MTLSPKQKKWAKRLLVLLVIRLALGGILYYVVVVRFKDLVQIAVKKESGGLYSFDASEVNFSLPGKTIVVRNAVLSCTDTIRSPQHHEVNIPQMYLAINSWTALIFHKKLVVDSFSMAFPSLVTHAHSADKKEEKQISFHASGIFTMLQKLAQNLEIRSFDIQNGAYTYFSKKTNKPFLSNRINLIIKNFSKKNDSQANKLFSSDDVNISLYNQHWYLPDGIHEISFKELHFSGKNQFFEIDSFTFIKAARNRKKAINLTAEKFFFNSTKLTSVYQKDELLIDTLICIRPILNLSGASPKKRNTETQAFVSETMQGLFKTINFKYIDIKEGQLLLNQDIQKDTTTITKTNLKIHNLTINPEKEPRIKTDSINFTLSKILFFSKDSLNQIGIQEFTLLNRDVRFKNASFGPTSANHSGKAMRFTAALLSLKNIDLEELLRKRLKATQADLYYPDIIVNNNSREIEKKRHTNSNKTDIIIQSANSISGLIDVPDFKIHHGNLRYISDDAAKPEMNLKNINAHILLTQLLESDSIINIKRSVPMFAVKEVTLQKPGLKLHIDNFSFNGLQRQNKVKQFHLSLTGGTSIDATDLFWENLDWNELINKNSIKVDKMMVKELAVNAFGTNRTTTPSPIKLPEINIRRLELNHLLFNSAKPNSHVEFSATAAAMDSITTDDNFIFWQHPTALFHNIVISNKNTHATIYSASVQNDEIRVDKTAFVSNHYNGKTSVAIPSLTVRAAVNSSNFSLVNISDIVVNEPAIDLVNYSVKEKEQSTATASIKIPLQFFAERLLINQASVKSSSIVGKDTSTLQAITSVHLSGIETHHHIAKLISFDKGDIQLSGIRYKKKGLNIGVPKLTVSSTRGILQKDENNNQLSFTSGLTLKWFDANFKKEATGDSVVLEAGKLTGIFEDDAFTIQRKTTLQWPALLKYTRLQDGNIYLKNKHFTARAASLEWDPSEAAFHARQYSLLPNLSEEATFKKAQWQADYMSFTGASLSIRGIQFYGQKTDSFIHVKMIELNNAALKTTRDKRIPFQHEIEKPMPSILMHSVKKIFRVDSVVVTNSSVTVNEISNKTNKKGTIPITNLQAVITNFNNNNKDDTLTIVAKGDVLHNHINNFYYREAKGDSLAHFNARVNISPMRFTSFSEVTVPLANVSILKGIGDTLFASWAGNKHGATGKMNFYYNDLKIQLLDKKNPAKKRFFLNVLSSLAGLLINTKNDRPAAIFFIRDKEKFVFNYWVKTLSSGALTSAGIKKNSKYRKQYNKVKEKYSLPPMSD